MNLKEILAERERESNMKPKTPKRKRERKKQINGAEETVEDCRNSIFNTTHPRF